MSKKPEGLGYLGRFDDNEPLPGRHIITINVFTEDRSMNFAIDVNEEFCEILKTTISPEAQSEMAHKLGWTVENALLKQLGLDPQ